ncbi:MAG: ABC transporter permease [Verrucomicrobia subdivision 3 bacterium]|nr:ABC transporter permease [Limisphaerales bacterium]
MKRVFQTTTWRKLQWPLLALVVVMVFNFLFSKDFFELTIRDGRVYGSLIDILNRAAPVMLLSLGMTLVIATGGVDLSVGAVMAISGASAALLVTKAGLPVPVVIAVSLGIALLAGLWNGLLVGFLGVPPIVATLILMVSGRGIAQLLTGGQIITFESRSLEFIARGAFLGLPFTITLVLLVFLVVILIQTRTAAGLFIEATGDNETASRYAGINTRFVKLLVYAFCAMSAGIAGLIAAGDIKAADANNAGLWLELDAILATVIGGTALQGGRFYPAGSLVGAVLIQSLTTTILAQNVNVQFTLVVKALVIIAVCLLQSESFRRVFVRRAVA